MLAGSGVAAADSSAAAEPEMVTFGLLGPVGLVAVVLGVLGMAAGVLRQRRRAAAKAVPAQPGAPDVTAMANAVLTESDDPTRPTLSPTSPPASRR
ncbi:hypothetical protein [Amycolatopsis nigrescens]|uniref:hypothetical protein n=1 Tax=Amycolatopsis nigrescens TaxID=381445 RepID=UPI003CCB9B5F